MGNKVLSGRNDNNGIEKSTAHTTHTHTLKESKKNIEKIVSKDNGHNIILQLFFLALASEIVCVSVALSVSTNVYLYLDNVMQFGTGSS